MSIEEGLRLMQDAVKRGAWDEARHVGSQTDRPLSLSSADVRFDALLATGSESRVYSGTYDSLPVAIKKPILRTTQDLNRFREEIKTMTSVEHGSIVQLLGARVLPPDYFLVMPLEKGSYYDALHKEGDYRLSWKEIVTSSLQLASAIQHIHEKGILHRDIKTRNILRGRDGGLKVIDFGMARKKEQGRDEKVSYSQPTGGFHKRSMVGTLEYMAPELLQHQGCSAASDVYAFAVTINELATGVYPFSDCNKEIPDAHTVLEMGYGRQRLATAIVKEGLRPTVPSQSPLAWKQLLEACWNLDPTRRPGMEQLHKNLEHILSSLTEINLPGQLKPLHHQQSVPAQIRIPPQGPKPPTAVNTSGEEPTWMQEIEQDSRCVADVTCGAFATAGLRGEDKMEDRHIVLESFMDVAAATVLGVFDGHRGYEAAEFGIEHFPSSLARNLIRGQTPEEALKKSFIEVETAFETTPMVQIAEPRGIRFPGCTALTALILKNTIYIANAGDCRAVLCRNGEAFQLSRDHTATDMTERQRIFRQGGASIAWRNGSWRVGEAGIQVTRSIGDIDLKPHGVSAIPEVTSFNLTPTDAFLIIASDGLWDTVSNTDAVKLVQATVKQPDMCAERLATEAFTRGSNDNITVIVAFLKPVSTFERIFANGKLTDAIRMTSIRHKAVSRPAVDELEEIL